MQSTSTGDNKSGAVDQYSASTGRKLQQNNLNQCWQQFYSVYPARYPRHPLGPIIFRSQTLTHVCMGFPPDCGDAFVCPSLTLA